MLGVGLWVLLSPYKIDILAILDNSIITAGVYAIIGLGAFIFLVGFLGCCGACCENRLLLVLVSCNDYIFWRTKVKLTLKTKLELRLTVGMVGVPISVSLAFWPESTHNICSWWGLLFLPPAQTVPLRFSVEVMTSKRNPNESFPTDEVMSNVVRKQKL